jgi:CRISPR-associated endonuclease/helicase Cas3
MTADAFPRLLAKSSTSPRTPRGEETLRGHTAMVVAAAETLLRLRAEASLRAAGLATTGAERLGRIVRLGAFVHDLGKASDHFQQMIRQRREAPQLVRHEALSLFLCWPGQPLADWLRAAVNSDVDYLLALVAAAGHHRKFWSSAVAPDEAGAGSRTTLLVTHPDFASTQELGRKVLDLPAPPVRATDFVVEATRRNHPGRTLDGWQRDLEQALPPGSLDARLLPIAKAMVLDADVAGSALPRAQARPTWIADQLGQRASRDDLEDLVRRRLGNATLRPFQRAVAASTAPVTLARAGCGTGKTVAAYQWAAAQHPGRQLWVTYPTTGTATEGFRDYVLDADIVGRLEHSRAAVDLEIFSLDDAPDRARELDRLDALRAWGADVVTCTVDTVLGLVQNQRRGLYAWAGLCDAAVVFDEVHAYDPPLFGALLRFLEALPGIPSLLMTASLPGARLTALREVVLRAHGRPLEEIAGPSDLEHLPRYVRSQEDVTMLVQRTLNDRGKVLWVSNTVDRCRGVAETWAEAAPLVYHSRFRYLDRVERHRDVVDAFRHGGPAFAVTTQVCEMSLDLSADLLVTDLAPIAALIQRLGRLNRRSTPDAPMQPKPFAVVPFEGLPYEPADLDVAARWLEELGKAELSQRALVDAWTADVPDLATAVSSAWLDGGFRTEVAPLREASPGITVLLADDAERVLRREVSPIEVALAMNPPPRSLGAWTSWRRVHHVPVAPRDAIDYDPKRGARWAA